VGTWRHGGTTAISTTGTLSALVQALENGGIHFLNEENENYGVIFRGNRKDHTLG